MESFSRSFVVGRTEKRVRIVELCGSKSVLFVDCSEIPYVLSIKCSAEVVRELCGLKLVPFVESSEIPYNRMAYLHRGGFGVLWIET